MIKISGKEAMIASLEGVVTEKLTDSIVISVGGVGFLVFASLVTINKFELHKMAALHTHMVVREDALTLYGFETLEEKEMFLMLLAVSGVGPRTAMAVVSSAPLDMIKKAVLTEQPELLARIPGIGKKTAQAIVLHMQGKIKGEITGGRGLESNIDSDVIAALTGLGYSLIEAQSALQMIPKETPEDLETRVRTALRYFS
ncbi:MAG TPA: Holliday junction branch migration protein RuvA [Anaerolineaceae bacterium]|nr:Holliday junction branch migration protein RuvA [Anaerolineaceae bacterium]